MRDSTGLSPSIVKTESRLVMTISDMQTQPVDTVDPVPTC